jgi:hypothetical protein
VFHFIHHILIYNKFSFSFFNFHFHIHNFFFLVSLRFDVIYDLVGQGKYDFTKKYLREYHGACYISIVHPVLRNFDQYGFAFGALRTAVDASCGIAKVEDATSLHLSTYLHFDLQNLPKGKQFHWGFHTPSSQCMKAVAKLVEAEKVSCL